MHELFPHRQKSAMAFTLMELMVAMSVLVLIMMMVTQIINSATVIATESHKHLEADAQARLVFSRMQSDFSNLVTRTDVDHLFVVSSSDIDEKLFFFSQTAAYYDSSITSNAKTGVALVGYRVVGTSGDATNFAPAFSLERLGKGLTWSGSNGAVHLSGTANLSATANTLAATWPTALGNAPNYTAVTPSDSDFHVLSDQVFRMAICFQVKDLASSACAYSTCPVAVASTNTGANISNISSSAPASGAMGDRWYDTQNRRACLCSGAVTSMPAWRSNGFKDVISIVVTLAVLDSDSRTVVPKDSSGNIDLSALAALFPAPVGDSKSIVSQLPASVWKTALETALQQDAATFANTYGIPKSVAAHVRIYQRHFFLVQ